MFLVNSASGWRPIKMHRSAAVFLAAGCAALMGATANAGDPWPPIPPEV